jgi:hypothetical protein
MTIKSFTVDPHIGYASMTDVYGGTQINIQSSQDLRELMQWWREWGPIFRNQHPSVQDAIMQVKVVHELSKAQNEIFPKSWTETTL